MNNEHSYLNEHNIKDVTLGFWPRSVLLKSVDAELINWFDRVIKFNLESKFIRVYAQAKKGRNTLHLHPDYPGYDIIIRAVYKFEGHEYDLEYKYRQNSHYVSARNKLCPINLNSMWALVSGKPANKLAFQALDEAFKMSFSSTISQSGYHRSYGHGSDIYEAIQSDDFKNECYKAIEAETSKSNKIRYSFKKSLASLCIDNLSNDEVLKIMNSAADISHILLAHKWYPDRMLEFLKKASINVVDAKSLTHADVDEIRAIRSIKLTHS